MTLQVYGFTVVEAEAFVAMRILIQDVMPERNESSPSAGVLSTSRKNVTHLRTDSILSPKCSEVQMQMETE